MDYKKKYLKYKSKYLKLNQIKRNKLRGGNLSPKIISLIGLGSVGLFTILSILYKIFSKNKTDIESTTDLDELKLNQLSDLHKDDSRDKLKEQIYKSNNRIEIKQLEDKYNNQDKQKKNKIKDRKYKLKELEKKNLQNRINAQYSKEELLLKNDSLDENRYKKLLKNIKVLEEKYKILFDKERTRRKNLIIDDYIKKTEKAERHGSLDKIANLETEYIKKKKILNDDMNNIDKKLKLHAVNFYLDYCEKKYLTGKLCVYKKDVLETERDMVKKYNDEQQILKDLMKTIRERLVELKNNNSNDTDEISHYEYLLDYYNNYSDNNFIEHVQKINQEIIETQIEIEQIFEKNKTENETKINNTIKHIKKHQIRPIKEELEKKLETIYEKKIQRIKQDHEKRKAKNQQIIDEKEKEKKSKEEELSKTESTSKKNTRDLEKISEYDIHLMREKLFNKDMRQVKQEEIIEREQLIKEKRQLKTLIKLLKHEINELTEKIEQLKQDNILVLPEIDTFKQDIEDYSKLLIKKFLTTEERQYYKEQNPKLKKKIANWIKETDVYNKHKDGLPEKEDKLDDSNNPDRTMSLGGKKPLPDGVGGFI